MQPNPCGHVAFSQSELFDPNRGMSINFLDTGFNNIKLTLNLFNLWVQPHSRPRTCDCVLFRKAIFAVKVLRFAKNYDGMLCIHRVFPSPSFYTLPAALCLQRRYHLNDLRAHNYGKQLFCRFFPSLHHICGKS